MGESTFQTEEKLTLPQLQSFLWGSVKTLPGYDPLEFIEYILGILCLKHLSDEFNEERESIVKYYLDKDKTQKQAEKFALQKEQYTKSFFIPECARWDNLKHLIYDIGETLNKATEAIEEQNSTLKGALVSINFKFKKGLDERWLKNLLNHFSSLRLNKSNFEQPDLLGTATEYLIEQFAISQGKRGMDFCTTIEIVNLLIKLLKPKADMTIYDPTCGSGGMLIQARNYLKATGQKTSNLKLSGQEINLRTLTVCKLNMLLHGVHQLDIRNGDTLKNPQHIENGKIMQFDRVIANPPLSLRNWGREYAENDYYERYKYGIPSSSMGDWAFIQHMIASLNQKGVLGVVVPHGVLFRGGAEENIRKRIISEDIIEAVIGLPPGLLQGSGIPIALLIINKNKSNDHKGKILFIDASHDFKQSRRGKTLEDENISKIVSCFEAFKEMDSYSNVISVEFIKKQKYNLSVRRYADNSPETKALKRLLKQYSDYNSYPLSELGIEIKGEEKKFKDIKNSIYIPIKPTQNPLTDYEKLDKLNNPLHIKLDPKLVINEYVSLFLKSPLGKLMLKNIAFGVSLQKIEWQSRISEEGSLSAMRIPVPELKDQKQIIKASKRLDQLREHVEDLENGIALSPLSTNTVLEKVENMLEVIGELTEGEKINSLIRKGESATLEFKESLSLDVKQIQNNKSYKPKKEDRMEVAVFKTIVAFLNSEGGCLLIGVHDEGTINGLQQEIDINFKGKKDNFLLHFKNQLKSKIGEQFYDFIHHRIISIGNKDILVVNCLKSDIECFLEGKDFYIRTNPATDLLQGAKLIAYIKTHFKKT